MRKTLLQTFLAIFITTLLIILSIVQGEGRLIIALFMFIFCAPFPTYIAVLIHNFVMKKTFPNKKLYASLFSILLLLSLYHLCLILYTAIDFYEPWSYFTDKLIHDYTDEFAVPTVLAVLLIISIPLADLLIEKVKRDLKDEK